MKTGVNNSHIRVMNQRTILEAIYNRDAVSRAELARILNMSKPAMAVNVSELLQLGIVREIGEGHCAEGGGRKPIMLQFNKEFRYIVAIDFYYSNSIFVLCDLRGQVRNRFAIRQTPSQNFDSWVDMCRNAIMTLLASQSLTPADLAAIGVSSPGVIHDEHQLFINSDRFGDYNIKQFYAALTQAFKCPVYIRNSTNASALGEWDCGAGQGVDNLLYVSCGQGLGSGMILGGKLYEGNCAAAGEIANFITPQSLDAPQSLEGRLCIAGLLDKVNNGYADGVRTLLRKEFADFYDVVELWNQGNAFVQQAVEQIALELGCAICNLVMTLNCDLVILGGEYLVFQRVLLPRINEMVQKHCIIPARVVASELGDNASTTGMVAICRSLFFQKVAACSQNGAQ